jgi:dihydrofolate reductase
MILSIIAAMATNRVIGRNNKMPWDLPSDRRRFHAITRGHPIILGRKTFESIGRPLSGRTNIIMTRNPGYRAAGCIVVHDLEAALAAVAGADETFVCGGEQIFRETIARVDRIYLTRIHQPVEGDAFFPEIPPSFTLVQQQEIEDVMPYVLLLYRK